MQQFFLWYGLAALVALFYAVQSYRKRNRIGTVTGNLFVAAGLVNIFYLVRMSSDSYQTISVVTSLYFIGIDLLLLFALQYAIDFTKPKGVLFKHLKHIFWLMDGLIVVDSLFLLGNIVREWGLTYQYEPESFYAVKFQYVKLTPFYVHEAFCYLMLAMIILILIWKAVSIPKIYRTRYSNSALVLLIVDVLNFVYVAQIWRISVDVSVLVY